MADPVTRNDKPPKLSGRGKDTDSPKWAVSDDTEQTAHEYNNPDKAVEAWNSGETILNLRMRDNGKRP